MNIIKTKNLDNANMENGALCFLNSDEKFDYYVFENEKCDAIELYEIEFEHCVFNKICIQNGKSEKITFTDVIFNQCNFSNTEFTECTFIRCQFNNCKIFGCNFADSRLYNVSFFETNAGYVSFSMASMENVLFKDTMLNKSYFQENKIKNLYFENADLTQSRFFKTSLKDVDLSGCKIEEIAITADDIKGAVIDQFQAVDLLYLIGVKLK